MFLSCFVGYYNARIPLKPLFPYSLKILLIELVLIQLRTQKAQ